MLYNGILGTLQDMIRNVLDEYLTYEKSNASTKQHKLLQCTSKLNNFETKGKHKYSFKALYVYSNF